jgi:hypothetical protein
MHTVRNTVPQDYFASLCERERAGNWICHHTIGRFSFTNNFKLTDFQVWSIPCNARRIPPKKFNDYAQRRFIRAHGFTRISFRHNLSQDAVFTFSVITAVSTLRSHTPKKPQAWHELLVLSEYEATILMLLLACVSLQEAVYSCLHVSGCHDTGIYSTSCFQYYCQRLGTKPKSYGLILYRNTTIYYLKTAA